jgi:GNAT superfamily N-acetyltransferase
MSTRTIHLIISLVPYRPLTSHRFIFLQICNAGFVVSPHHRGGGYGSILGESYLHYGPKLGYRASVFNLVYVNNVASVR